jgi:hypothetical protein
MFIIRYYTKEGKTRRKFIQNNPHEEFKETPKQKANRTEEVFLDLGLVKKEHTIEKLEKEWKDLLHYKLPLFGIVCLFIFPPALAFLPFFFLVKAFFIKIPLNKLKNKRRK